mmetsp:Transcript_32287/g.48702  ORF Transcript_32287/g.48702 Transcript_32287/m.48702 type:complete len:93 (-) Transcript_32287:735-1013(-)
MKDLILLNPNNSRKKFGIQKGKIFPRGGMIDEKKFRIGWGNASEKRNGGKPIMSCVSIEVSVIYSNVSICRMTSSGFFKKMILTNKPDHSKS